MSPARLPVAAVIVVVAAMVFLALREPAPDPAPVADGVPAGAQAAVVETVVDGDTIWVRVDETGGALPRGVGHKIRLLEIDAPETSALGGGPECGGTEATAFTRRRLPVGSVVHLVADREDRDRYGRFLRYAWTNDGDFFNLDAVRTGHARAVLFEPNDAYIDVMRDAEAQAREEGLGLWGAFCRAGG